MHADQAARFIWGQVLPELLVDGLGGAGLVELSLGHFGGSGFPFQSKFIQISSPNLNHLLALN